MEKIYKKIAKQNGVSVEEVKRDMQEAINAAYKNPTIFASNLSPQKDVPTTEEFIKLVANKVRNTK